MMARLKKVKPCRSDSVAASIPNTIASGIKPGQHKYTVSRVGCPMCMGSHTFYIFSEFGLEQEIKKQLKEAQA